MARAYSGVLGTMALCLTIVRGLLMGLLPDEILAQGLWFYFGFAALGFVIGWTAEQTIRESMENRFRSEIQRLQLEAAAKSSETAE